VPTALEGAIEDLNFVSPVSAEYARRELSHLRGRLRDAEDLLNTLQWVHVFACHTGDCTHDTVHGCLEYMRGLHEDLGRRLAHFAPVSTEE
jgi:hypothetical protein